MQQLKALVLAAGKSTRIASVAGGLPKPLIRIQGETILERNLRWLSREGIRQVWVNLHYRPDEIKRVIGDASRFGLDVWYAYEPELRGTAGAVRNCSSDWECTFLVVYGDNLLSLDLRDFFTAHKMHKASISIALFDQGRHPHTGIAGGWVTLGQDGHVKGFREGVPDTGARLVNAGVYLMEPHMIADIPSGQFCDFGRDLFPRLLVRGEAIYGHVINGYCLGVDTPERYGRAIKLIETGEVQLP